jgi:hypothetical protein
MSGQKVLKVKLHWGIGLEEEAGAIKAIEVNRHVYSIEDVEVAVLREAREMERAVNLREVQTLKEVISGLNVRLRDALMWGKDPTQSPPVPLVGEEEGAKPQPPAEEPWEPPAHEQVIDAALEGHAGYPTNQQVSERQDAAAKLRQPLIGGAPDNVVLRKCIGEGPYHPFDVTKVARVCVAPHSDLERIYKEAGFRLETRQEASEYLAALRMVGGQAVD